MRNLIMIILAIAFIGLMGCEKDADLNKDQNKTAQLRTSNPVVVTFNGEELLKFSAAQSFIDKGIILDSLLEYWTDQFVGSFNITNESLYVNWDSIAIANNFEPQQPLIDFENNIGFDNSLRIPFNQQESLWLQDTSNLHPFEKYEFVGGELSLVNSKQRVMIGDTIYQFNDNSIYKIYGNYSTLLSQIDNGNTPDPSKTLFFGWFDWWDRDPDCNNFENTSNIDFVYWNNEIKQNIFIAEKISFANYFGTYERAKATIKAYKMTLNDVWTKYWGNLEVGAQLQSYRHWDCDELYKQKWSRKYKRDRHVLRVRAGHPLPTRWTRTKNGKYYPGGACYGMYGIDNYNSGNNGEFYLLLQW